MVERNARDALAATARFLVVALYGPWAIAEPKTPATAPLAALQAHSTMGDFRTTRDIGRKT